MMRAEKLRILTLGITTLSIKTLSETDHNDIQYNDKNLRLPAKGNVYNDTECIDMHSIVNAGCCLFCRAECRGALS